MADTVTYAKDIYEYFADNGIGTGGTDLFYHNSPEGTGFQILVMDTGGFDPNLHLDPDDAVRRPTIQVMIRGAKYGFDEAYAKAEEIIELIDQEYNLEINSTRYISIHIMGGILDLGRDTNECPKIAMNFVLEAVDAVIAPVNLVADWRNFNIEGADPSFNREDGYTAPVFVDDGDNLQLPANFLGISLVVHEFDSPVGASYNIKVTLDPAGSNTSRGIELKEGFVVLGSDYGAKTDFEIVASNVNTLSRLSLRISAGDIQQYWKMTNFEMYAI